MFGKLRNIFESKETPRNDERVGLSTLSAEEKQRIGTELDPLRGYEAAVERHEQAMQADRRGDPDAAIRLYEQSVAEGFVGSHPYDALASLHERRHDHEAALHVTDAYIHLAQSGTMPRGAQRSADRKLPDFQARASRCKLRIHNP
ncbi:MAG: hypothetical protein M3Q54_07520 [Actinomycetota bacterium]|nr:hypothetical protein [Actinomycetota bacterium]